ncbi:hypothetical protein SAMN05216466_106198 [Paraburkholderia phenazinium]|uniref:Uncharacterized protein n=1 Tax=Paraburkholderia phenazinium TaxID=60549 RepID=A0A1G7YIM3_9BURK|nr:hypothetical protein [Paraburkholderia phenazinium]SDG96156.1 hypothetical protein SAMN05216466_106198 [Paraburkholderia phenazinium]
MKRTRTTHRALTALSLTVLTLALAACGGGGGGSSGAPSGTSSGTGSGTTTSTTSGGAALLAAYTVPASITAATQTSYTGPAFNVGTSAIQSNCGDPAKVSSTVIVLPDLLVFSAGASLKAQQLEADLMEQAIAQDRTALNWPVNGTGFDGSGNRLQLCVDPTLGASDSETGTSVVGQTGSSVGPVMQLVSADSPNWDATDYKLPVGNSFYDLSRHEAVHALLFAETEPFTALPTWFQEGMATTLSQLPMPSKATILSDVSSNDLISDANLNTNGNVYPAYEATISLMTGSTATGGLGFPLTSMRSLVDAFKTKAMAACAQAIPTGVTEPAYTTVGLPAGQFNTCASPNGTVSPSLSTAFDQTFNAAGFTYAGAPLLLLTSDGGVNLESNLGAMLSAFLP